ncbi:MAG TPA: Hsp20/alpha crystallin family protein [Deinococcales bacterium]|nr:Hsp20/alpha crystallin family protein [Deinococcales bacterium]
MLRYTTNPWQLLDELTRTLDSNTGTGARAMAGEFPMDVIEENDHLLVKVNLPGVKPESVNLSLENNTLSLQAELLPEEGTARFLMRERPIGTVRRTVTLPVRVNPERSEASLENGVLIVRVFKAPEATARKITVNAAGQRQAITNPQG